jgi:hypothetical protein
MTSTGISFAAIGANLNEPSVKRSRPSSVCSTMARREVISAADGKMQIPYQRGRCAEQEYVRNGIAEPPPASALRHGECLSWQRAARHCHSIILISDTHN